MLFILYRTPVKTPSYSQSNKTTILSFLQHYFDYLNKVMLYCFS